MEAKKVDWSVSAAPGKEWGLKLQAEKVDWSVSAAPVTRKGVEPGAANQESELVC